MREWYLFYNWLFSAASFFNDREPWNLEKKITYVVTMAKAVGIWRTLKVNKNRNPTEFVTNKFCSFVWFRTVPLASMRSLISFIRKRIVARCRPPHKRSENGHARGPTTSEDRTKNAPRVVRTNGVSWRYYGTCRVPTRKYKKKNVRKKYDNDISRWYIRY